MIDDIGIVDKIACHGPEENEVAVLDEFAAGRATGVPDDPAGGWIEGMDVALVAVERLVTKGAFTVRSA